MTSMGGGPSWPGFGPGVIGAPVGVMPSQDPRNIQSLQAQCARMLQHLHGWLRTVVPQAPYLATAIPLVIQAVHMYRNGQYEACLTQLQTVRGMLNPAGQSGLPPL